jgi:hypothetical protein
MLCSASNRMILSRRAGFYPGRLDELGQRQVGGQHQHDRAREFLFVAESKQRRLRVRQPVVLPA